jgi:pimeloyl-ACP methyl ester carboxylesterase
VIDMRGDLFKLTNARGQTIKGIAFGPAHASGTGVVYLPGIVLGMTAVHRMGIELAHELALDGHVTYLFDPAGIGDSEGDFPAGTHQQVSAWVEAGNLVEDTLLMIDFVTARTGVDRVVLIGHCSGAVTASYAAARHPAVSGVLLLCPPTLELASAPDELEREAVATVFLRLYLHKLWTKEAWLRLLRGRSSYRTIWRLMIGKLRRSLALGDKRPPTGTGPRQRAFNERLRTALHTLHTESKQLAVIFGDHDPDLANFREFARDHTPTPIAATVFPDTSHGFVTENSIALLTAEARRFVSAVANGAPRWRATAVPA